MKKEDFAKLGIEDEDLLKKLEEASADELKGYIPKDRFNEVNEAKKKLEEDLKDRDKQLETLKNSTGDMESLKAEISKLQESNKEADKAHKAEIKKLQIDNAISSALSEAKAKNNQAVKALLKNLDKAELDDSGKVIGLSEQIKALQESDGYLFDTDAPTIKGATPNAGTGKPAGITKEQFDRMSLQERSQLFETDRDTYNQLAGHN